MNFNHILTSAGIDPAKVIVLRHRPTERELRRALPWLAAERHEIFNAYQRAQPDRLESAMNKLIGRGYLASFIGERPGTALFVGLYSIAGGRRMSIREFNRLPENQELVRLGSNCATEDKRPNGIIWFDLRPEAIRSEWKGRLLIGWPGIERSWWRRAEKNDFPVLAIHERRALDQELSDWSEIALTWNQLRVMPRAWETKLSEWRAIYYIRDSSDGKGYVGSACGKDNLIGRWLNYAADGHGGNKLLRARNPENFVFSILQRVSPDSERDEVIRIENTWKLRLHTRAPDGLNEN